MELDRGAEQPAQRLPEACADLVLPQLAQDLAVWPLRIRPRRVPELRSVRSQAQLGLMPELTAALGSLGWRVLIAVRQAHALYRQLVPDQPNRATRE